MHVVFSEFNFSNIVMKKTYIKYQLYLIIILFLVSSCWTKNYVYIHEKQKHTDTLEYFSHYEEYRLKTEDLLYIKIKSINPQLQQIFSLQNTETSGGSGGNSGNYQGAFYLTGYKLDEIGNVDIPLIGTFNLNDKTVQEAENIIQEATNVKFKDAVVIVRLVDLRITFMGEIAHQGVMLFHREQINLLEALAEAGGITPYGNYRKILIIRATETGSKTFLIDVSKRDVLSNNEFYLRPNDIVYVEPRKTKPMKQLINDYGTVLSLLTTTLATVTLILNLIK